MRRRAAFLLVAVGACMMLSCSKYDDQVVLVMAASSLTDAFGEIELEFEQANPGIDVQLNLASSFSLREQVLQGAPADVFASANVATMSALAEQDEVFADATRFATNDLMIAVPVQNAANVTGVEDLARKELLIGQCASGAPCGDFATQALRQAGVEPAIDTFEPNVRSLLTKIEAGELDAGIVYATDVLASDQVIGLPLPASVVVDIDYPIVDLRRASPPEAASIFVEFVLSERGQEILASWGFGPR